VKPVNRSDKLQPRDRRGQKPTPAPKKTRPDVALGPANYALMAAGLAVIVAGFITLSAGSITLAPILLVLGYCVLIPLSLLVTVRRGVARSDAPAAPDAAAATKPDGSGN
jgi:hypothetical protein